MCVCVETGGVWRDRGVCVGEEMGVFVCREILVWLWREWREDVERKMGVCGGQLETDEGRRKRLGCLGVWVRRERHSLGLSVGVCVLERLGIVFVDTGVLLSR